MNRNTICCTSRLTSVDKATTISMQSLVNTRTTFIAHVFCFLPFLKMYTAKSFKLNPYQVFEFDGAERIPLGLTRMCPTTFPSSPTIVWSSNFRGWKLFVDIVG